MPRGVKWWIPAAGLAVTATLITAGFGWTVGNAARASAQDALDGAGIAGVDVENSYRDITLHGPGASRDAAVSVVEPARLVQSVAYIVADPVEPTPSASPSPSPSASASPVPSAEPSPSPDVTCLALTPECMGGSAWLASALTADDSVFFGYDSAALSAASRGRLDQVAEKIAAALEHDDGVAIVIAGHTDSRGSSAYNDRLSRERARTVRDYLLAQGVPARVITVAGRGESGFLASNSTAEGRALNRRVDFEVRGDFDTTTEESR